MVPNHINRDSESGTTIPLFAGLSVPNQWSDGLQACL
jgi:hypothetical protein